MAELAWRICACVQKYSNTYVQKHFNTNTHTHTQTQVEQRPETVERNKQ